MFGTIFSAVTLGVPADSPLERHTLWPSLSVILAANALMLSGMLSGGVFAVVIGAALLASVVIALLRGREFLASTRTRRLGALAFPATVPVLLFVCMGAYMPQRCAELAPGIFFMAFPAAMFCAVLGGRLAAASGKAEGWVPPEMPNESLGGFVCIGGVAALLLAGSWLCTPHPVSMIALAFAVAFAGLGCAGLFEKNRGPDDGAA